MAGSHGTALGSTRVGSTGARIAVGSTGAGTGAGVGIGVEITLFVLLLVLVLALVSTDAGVVPVLVVDDEVETVLGLTTAPVVVSGTTTGLTVTGATDGTCAELVVDDADDVDDVDDVDDDELVVVDEAADVVVDALDAAVVVSTGTIGVG